jgi:adenosine deaminase
MPVDGAASFLNWARTLPKLELHLHLEGAIPHDALWQLICKYGGDPAVPNRQALPARFRYRDFPHFIETWIWKNEFLRSYEDFTLIAEAMAADLRGQNIRYAECFFSPTRFAHHGLTVAGLAQAIRAGLDRVSGIQVRLIADLVRDHGPERADATLSEVAEVAAESGIAGIGIGGSEHAYPPAPFAQVYERARRLGLRTSAHAGEAAGVDSVRDAVEILRVDRVGHATRAEEDPAVVDLLAATRVALEMCPLSNRATGTVTDIADHPVRRYFERGLNVTINTDDPHMFGNSMADEYVLLHDTFGFSRDDIRRTVLNAIDASWQDDASRETLRRSFTSDPVWQAA